MAHDLLGEHPRIAALLHRVCESSQGLAGIMVDERLDEFVVRKRVGRLTAGRGHELERRQCVPGRTSALREHGLEGILRHHQPGVRGHPPDVRLEFVHRQQVELEVLDARADGGTDLLRVGRREHEHDVWWRLLEGLEQRSLGALREHVHLVEDVHLVPTRGTE